MPASKTTSLLLSLVDIKQDNLDTPSFTRHPHNLALAVSVASELSIRNEKNKKIKLMSKRLNLCLSPWRGKGKEGEKEGRKRRTRICGRYRFWRTITKVFADGRHTECEHGADCTHHNGVEKHWRLMRLTLLWLCCEVETSRTIIRQGHKVTKRSKCGKTYEVAVGVAEWRDDGRHCFFVL